MEKGEEENEESMEFFSSQFSDFQEDFDSWENSSEMVEVGTQDSEMVRVDSQNSDVLGDLGECPTPVGTQESSQQSDKSSMDSSYSPGEDADQEEEEEEAEEADKISYVIVKEGKLRELLAKNCQQDGCLNPCQVTNTTRGLYWKASLECPAGHIHSWEASETVTADARSTPVLNLLMTLFILLTGCRFQTVQALFKHMGVYFLDQRTYYRHLRTIIYPVIWCMWLVHQSEVLQEARDLMAAGSPINLAGDGRYDSPGFNAAFCTYYLMILNSKKVGSVYVAHKRQVTGGSGAMEPAALAASLQFLKNAGLKIQHLVTDRSTTVRAMLRDLFPEINNQADPWHFVKNLKKQWWKDGKTKSGAAILEWIKSMTNMIWWALETSLGKPRLAREKLLSMFGHISGVHEFPLHSEFRQCEHPVLPEDRDKPYLKKGSKALQKVVEAVNGFNNHNLDDLVCLDAFLHTGDLESLNALLLVYMPKRVSYSVAASWIRSVLAAMDHNNNIDRAQAKTLAGKLQWKIQRSRGGKDCSLKKVRSAKNNLWKDNIAEAVLECAVLGKVPAYPIPVDPAISESLPQLLVTKEEMIHMFATRMGMSDIPKEGAD